jgi:hypothetical protein
MILPKKFSSMNQHKIYNFSYYFNAFYALLDFFVKDMLSADNTKSAF